ncbi:MAG: DUF4864 domain-containing protein [Myxococcota bacterium]
MWALWLALALVEPALAQSPSDAIAALEQQRGPIESMVRDQIEAFRRDDAAAAWKPVAPGLKRQLGTADRFLEMVREGYAPVYRPQRYSFGRMLYFDGGPAQSLDVVGPDGKPYRAIYLLEQQPDGTWATAGCILFAVEPAGSPST